VAVAVVVAGCATATGAIYEVMEQKRASIEKYRAET